jgi:LPXTG-site transpeptidase (sortase) family protein
LFLLGFALLLAASGYYSLSWLSESVEATDRTLRIGEIGELAVSASSTPTVAAPEAAPASAATTGLPSQVPSPHATEVIVALPTATFVSRVLSTPTPELQPSPTPEATPTATPAPPLPVRIRIPAIGVDRSIVELAPVRDAKTGTYQLNVKSLFRRPGTDLVGHWVGSASPGQPGNMILVGHNYGYGYNGVFLNVGRLKTGQVIYVVDKAGGSHGYEVTEVKRVKWSKKSEQELMRHQAYLTIRGEERLTLVTCGGATWEPFPDRVYVVAEPVP